MGLCVEKGFTKVLDLPWGIGPFKVIVNENV